MTIGENIRNIRKSKRLTMKDIANKLDMTEQAISQYERNIRTPNTKLVLKIADILNVSPQQIDPDIPIWQEFDNNIDTDKLSEEVKILDYLSKATTNQLIQELNNRDDFPINIKLK